MDAGSKEHLKALATAHLRGENQTLETAIELAKYEADAPPELRVVLESCVVLASETDAIPLGARRAFWHPDVREREDQRHEDAQAWAAPIVREVCERLIALL